MPHQQPSVDDYDSDESKAQHIVHKNLDSGDVAGKRTPRPYGPGLDAKARRGSDSGYSSRTATTFDSTNSTQDSKGSRTEHRAGSGTESNKTNSTLNPNKTQTALRRDGSLPRRPNSPPREDMLKSHRPRRDEDECTDPNCQCRLNLSRNYPRDSNSLPYRSATPSKNPPSNTATPYPNAGYSRPTYPPSIPRPRASTSSQPRPSSYYAGMPTDGYYVPVGSAPIYGAPPAVDSYYSPALAQSQFSSYPAYSTVPSDASYLPLAVTAPAPPRYETRPKLRPLKTEGHASRSRPSLMYGTPVVSYDLAHFGQTPYERPLAIHSAGANVHRDFNSFDYYEDRRRMPPPARSYHTSPDELVPTRRASTRESRPSQSARSTSYDPGREEYDNFDANVNLPSSRTPSRRRPSIGQKSASYAAYNDPANPIGRVIESRSGRRSSYSADEARAKTERAMGESERYQADVSGRAQHSSSARPKDPIDQIPLQKSSRQGSDSRHTSHSRSRTGSSHDSKDMGQVKINFDKDGAYSISVNDDRPVRMVPQEDGGKEIIIGGTNRDTSYHTGSFRSTASSSRTGRSGGPREDVSTRADAGRRESKNSRRRSDDES